MPPETRRFTAHRPLSHAVAAAALAVAAYSQILPAQGPYMLDGFYSRNDALPGSPNMGGLTFTGYSGMFGIRVGGALNFVHRDPFGDQQQQPTQNIECDPSMCGEGGQPHEHYGYSGVAIGDWSADADIVFAPLRVVPVLKQLLLGFSPYAFVGIGGFGVRPATAPDTTVATWSYGAGVQHQMFGGLGIAAEARYRQPLNSGETLPQGWKSDWEYRIGLNISFGGHKSEKIGAAQNPSKVPPAPAPVPPPPRHEAAYAPPIDSRAQLAGRIVARADRLVGTRYHYGGASPADGFDAAGYVQYVFGKEGVELPRTSREIANVGEELELRIGALRPGDLLFFANDGSEIDHVAIYAGHDQFLHSTASGHGVRYDALDDSPRGQWFADHLVAARRVVDGQHRGGQPDEGFDPPDRAPRPTDVP